jgi:hypothetical protein
VRKNGCFALLFLVESRAFWRARGLPLQKNGTLERSERMQVQSLIEKCQAFTLVLLDERILADP